MDSKLDHRRALEVWFATIRDTGIDIKTLVSYRRGVEDFIIWYCQSYQTDFMPSTIITQNIVDWQFHQQKIEAAYPNTISQRLDALASFFEWAVIQGLAAKNPVEGIDNISL